VVPSSVTRPSWYMSLRQSRSGCRHSAGVPPDWTAPLGS
jgi:hypothetical protein